ncbi:MAG TPA: hypothetical protein VJG32_10145 [Anaerolineae bacterium]|nr:hypothetical protein [Anaerolineae bacterium]
MLGLILVAFAYSSWLDNQPAPTETQTLEGSIGVILGLYVCSHPAANAVDRWLFGRSAQRRISSRRSETLWLAVNILVLVMGWIVIFIGATRFTAGAA